MATAFRRCLTGTKKYAYFLFGRVINADAKAQKSRFITKFVYGCTAGAVVTWYLVKNNTMPPINIRLQASKSEERGSEKRVVLQTQRELRFLTFASIEYDGNVYMTPQDFLESVTEEAPRARAGRRHLGSSQVEAFFGATPGKRHGSSYLFRNIHDKGLISYTEYLFLLCVLTKPKSGFKIAFNMFDTDGNQRVDKQEFLVLLDIYENRFGSSSVLQTDRVVRRNTSNIWTYLQHAASSYEGIISGIPRNSMTADRNVQPILDTTLTVHFFGRKGNETLKYEDFHRFMDNLQTEVLELEFGEFSHGMKTISEEEFAQILLRYTILSAEEHEEYLQRLRSRVLEEKGITFKDFKDFCQFLNNLDDFALAMRMYTYANQPISQEDFKRAVKACTGQSLSDHVVDVVYKLFDKDGDGRLSHKEFISVMKDRLHRGFRSYSLPQNRWDYFKSCVKDQMKTA